MTAKKIIVKLIFTALFMIALNLSFQPAQSNLFQRERHSIVRVIDIADDPYMSGFIESNKKAIRRISVSLTAEILATDSNYIQYDSS